MVGRGVRRSETRPTIANYAREKLRAELAAKGRGARSALAKELGVTKSAITGFLGTSRSAPRGAGEDLLGLLAAHWSTTPAGLEQEAVRICLAGNLRADAVKRVLEEEADYVTDPAVLIWIRLMLLAADDLNARTPLPRARKASG